MGTNSLARLDFWLIDHVAQPVVDWCARTRGIGRKTLAVQTALGGLVMTVALTGFAVAERHIPTALMSAVAVMSALCSLFMALFLWQAASMSDRPSPRAPVWRIMPARLPLLMAWICRDVVFYGAHALGRLPWAGDIRLHLALSDAWMACVIAHLYIMGCRTTPPEVRRRVPAGAIHHGAA